jgi:Holliday junction resolvase RusA-like endonuclease
MSEIIRLYLPPKSCPRPRVSNGVVYHDPSYQTWMKEAIKQFRGQWLGKERLSRIEKLSIQFYGWNRSSDLSNLFKSPEDAIVQAGILRDDNLTVVSHIEAAWEKAASKNDQGIEIHLDF